MPSPRPLKHVSPDLPIRYVFMGQSCVHTGELPVHTCVVCTLCSAGGVRHLFVHCEDLGGHLCTPVEVGTPVPAAIDLHTGVHRCRKPQGHLPSGGCVLVWAALR